MTDLSRKRERERLAVRADPYFQRLTKGAALGFRRGPDTWSARFRNRSGKQIHQPLGEALDYDEAKRRAEAWIARLTGAPVRSVKRHTVKAALLAYLAHLRRQGREDTAKDAESRFKSTVFRDPERDDPSDDPLANLKLEAATREDFLDWRDRLRAGRAARTVNRRVRAVVAGLNCALELGHIGNPLAWTLPALGDDVEDEGDTAVFLTPEQRRGIIAATDPYTAAFLRGLHYCGARPQELPKVDVGHFDGECIRLAHKKGRPPKLRVRHTVLSEDGVRFFAEQARNKRTDAPLFTEDGETRWRRHTWSRRLRAAIEAYNATAAAADKVPEAATAYSFRHARISELLQVHNIDPLTVAAQTGTSLQMIEQAYFKFIPSAMREKLAAVRDSSDTP